MTAKEFAAELDIPGGPALLESMLSTSMQWLRDISLVRATVEASQNWAVMPAPA